MFDQSDYIVESRSNADLRRIAEIHRLRIDAKREGKINIVQILEAGSIEAEQGRKRLILLPLPDEELGKDDAVSISEKHLATVKVKESVLRAARNISTTSEHRRAVFTLVHEYFHIVLCHDRAPMARATGVSIVSSRPSFIPPYQSAEHQANYSSGVLLIDPDIARECRTAGEIRLRFNVSMKTAEIFIAERLRQQKSPVVATGLRMLSQSLGENGQSQSRKLAANVELKDAMVCAVCGRGGGCDRSNCCKHKNVGRAAPRWRPFGGSPVLISESKGTAMSDNRSGLGLNNRHRDADGRIDRKHGNTLVRTLRDTYGDNFAPGTRGDTKLSTLLERENSRSLSNYLKR